MPQPTTLLEAVRHFSDLDVTHEYMVNEYQSGHKVRSTVPAHQRTTEFSRAKGHAYMLQAKTKDG